MEGVVVSLSPEELNKLKTLLKRADQIERLLSYIEYLEDSGALQALVSFLVTMKPLIEYVPDPRELSEAVGRWFDELSKSVAKTVEPFVPVYETFERELSKEDLVRIANASVNILKTLPDVSDPAFIKDTINTIKAMNLYLEAVKPLMIAYENLRKDVSIDGIMKAASILAVFMKVVPSLVDPQKLKEFSEILQEELKKPPKRYGMRSLLAALREEDVQRGLGIVIAVLRALGRTYK